MNFCLPSTYQSYAYTMLYSIKCIIALCLKNFYVYIHVCVYLQNTSLLKDANYHLSFQRAFLLMESLCLSVNGHWWLKVGMAMAISWKKTTVKFAASTDFLFTNDFSVAHKAAWWHFYHRTFQNWSQCSQILLLFYQLSVFDILNALLLFQSSHFHQEQIPSQ